MRRGIFSLISGLLLCFATLLNGAEIIPPAPARYFNDYAGVTKPATQQRLNAQLEQFEKDTSSQIIVAVFPKLPEGAALEDFTIRTATAWRVGRKSLDNGAVLFVFAQDRKMRIEVGYGLEGAIPDAIAKRIISDEITPRFRSGDFDGGLSAGVTALMQAARGEYKGTGTTVAQKRRGNRFPVGPVFWILLAIVILSSFRRRRGTFYTRRGRSGWGAPVIWSGGSGWRGGGGGGGGFSGGGGRFGGGGASGSW